MTPCKTLVSALGLAALSGFCAAAEPADAEAARSAVTAHFEGPGRSMAEKAVWASPRVFAVGVHYMGSDESHVARDVCDVLAQHGLAGGVTVRVIDINTMGADQDRWEVVGEARCS